LQDINNGSKNKRGSSPPFQESERWIEDGANGSHWVKMLAVNLEQPVDRITESLDSEPGVEPVSYWKDDGGNSVPPAKQDSDK
jgi:hypothetical protein